MRQNEASKKKKGPSHTPDQGIATGTQEPDPTLLTGLLGAMFDQDKHQQTPSMEHCLKSEWEILFNERKFSSVM